MLKKILIGFLLFFTVLFIFTQVDDHLTDESEQLLNLAKNTEESEAFLYLMGISAPENKDPIQVGKEQKEKRNDSETLKIPDAFRCNDGNANCLQLLFSDEQSVLSALESNKMLINRYEAFIKLAGFRNLSTPDINEVLPDFLYLKTGNRLWLLSAIDKIKRNHNNIIEVEAAVSSVFLNIDHIRRHLKTSNTIISKLVFLSMLAENLDVLSILKNQYAISFTEKMIPSVARLERDLAVPVAREFLMFHKLFNSFDRNPAILDKAGKKSQSLPGWVVRALFKPGISTNAIFPVYKKSIDNSLLSAKEFAKLTDRIIHSDVEKSWVRNSIGTILNETALPDYHSYIARFHDVDVKISMLNTLNSSENKNNEVLFINPYYPGGEQIKFSEEKNEICLPGPMKDERNYRCLPLKV